MKSVFIASLFVCKERIHISLYINKKDSVPVRIAIDFTTFSAAFLGSEDIHPCEIQQRCERVRTNAAKSLVW